MRRDGTAGHDEGGMGESQPVLTHNRVIDGAGILGIPQLLQEARSLSWREKMKRLSEKGLAVMMKRVPRWIRIGDSIERTWRFESFLEAVAFMNLVFALAENADHHPDLTNVWTTVKIRYTTHDAGGLTKKDFNMAMKIDRLA